MAVTATSLALVSSVPLTREGLTPERTARHVVAASWLSLAIVAAAAGVFALAGEPLARWVLGSEYSGGTGAELGRLVVYLAPWMVASVAVSVTFPLLFVRGRARVAAAARASRALVVQVPVEWVAREAFGLAGIAGGMAVTTGARARRAALVARLARADAARRGRRRGRLRRARRGRVRSSRARCSAPCRRRSSGSSLYAAVLLSWRPAGLRAAWAYARALR